MQNTLRKIAENINTEKKTSGQYRGNVLFDAPMSDRTTFCVGGSADVCFEPADVPSLQLVLEMLHDAQEPYLVLGGGSNLVVSDAGIRRAVISTAGLRNIEENQTDAGTVLCCGAGTPVGQVTSFCRAHGWSGLEHFAGLPGTVGGGAYMNARCYDISFSDVLVSAEYMTGAGTVSRYDMNAADWAYKKSPFQPDSAVPGVAGSIVLSVCLQVAAGLPQEIEQRAESFVENRRSKGHFAYPSAGSVFKNNRAFGKPSGQLIDEAGLCGLCCGDAQVAPWHGNFIVNKGHATAADIKKLVQTVTEKVYDSTGFLLECEIIFVE